MKYLMGIDNGSQSSKVVIYDLKGNIISEGRIALKPNTFPAPGHVEHPDDDIWDSIKTASKIAIKNFPDDLEKIVGVGLCTIRCCRALLKEDGTLAHPVLSWMDERVASNYVHENDECKYVTTSSGYITHRLTGEFKDTSANYVGTWPIDSDTWNWTTDQKIFNSFDIPREMLFDLVMPNDQLGCITKEASLATGIPEGLPVFATSNDKAVEALGAGLLRNNTILVSLGTYICAMVQGKGNYKNSENFWTNFSDIPNGYLYESFGIRRGMWTVSWMRDLVFDHNLVSKEKINMEYEEFLNKEAEHIPAGSEGLLTLLDFLAPPDQPHKRGVMVGFNGSHKRAHMYRSILEAIAMTMKINSDNMVEELKIIPKQVIVTGGGSNSELFMQIFADVFGIPAVRNKINGCASLGAAINASIGLGIYENFAIATEEMIKIERTFQPNMENYKVYKKIIDTVYKNLLTYNDELLKKIHEIN